MEVRASYVFVGSLAMGLVLALLFFIMWIAGDDQRIPMSTYEIYVRESVAGLSVGNPVLFTGVRVGSVRHITISETEPGAVVVRVALAADTPVREDSEASIAMQGITGVAVISISGGSAQSPLMKPVSGAVGSITFKPSPLASVMEGVPQTISSLNSLLDRMHGAFSQENVESLTTILSSLATITSSVADKVDRLDAFLGQLEAAGKNLVDMSDKGKRMVDGLRPGVEQFSREGMMELRMLLQDTRAFVQGMNRVVRQLESNPARFLMGEQVKEYDN